ncbi:MAG: hypothetical protein ACJ72U_05200 [Nitrososphaeraceae archaeon]
MTIRECHYHESILSNFEDRLAQEQVQDEENNISNTTKGYPEEAEEIEKSASNADNTVRKTIPSFNSTNTDWNLRKYRSRRITRKIKTNLKECHFCKLEHRTDKERTEYEITSMAY